MKKILFSIFIALMLSSCADKMTAERISTLESQAFDEDGALNNDSAVELVDAYLLFAEQNPDEPQSPEYLFKAIDVSVNLNAISNPLKTIDIANILIEKYPDFEMSPMAMYIKGFVYENQLQDLKNAEMTYRQFIEKYPESPMVEDVKATLENLGLTPEELIRKFESKNEAAE